MKNPLINKSDITPNDIIYYYNMACKQECEDCLFKYYDYIKHETMDLKPFKEWLRELLNETG